MKRVLVLGGSGMLGSMVASYLSRQPDFEITASVRNGAGIGKILFEWQRMDLPCMKYDWVVNAIGITKPLIQDANPSSVENAIRVNAMLPHAIAERTAETGARVLHITTDCVYSGAKGGYVESDAHDALDVYGKTKSLGECHHPHVHHLRCSLVGPEPKEYKFLLEWFLRQVKGASVNGFANHRWNGITTLHFAMLCRGIMESGMPLEHLQHVVPTGDVTKAQLLREFAGAYNRPDVQIRETDAAEVIDRRLATASPALNCALWTAAGYETPPTIPRMIAELAAAG